MYQINIFDTNDIRAVPIPNMREPVAVEYDNTTGTVYWSDLKDQAVYKASISKPGVQTAVLEVQKSGKKTQSTTKNRLIA